jgi:hypothetical protein
MKVAQLAAQSGDPQFAMAIADAGRQLQASVATARKTTAEAQKAELSLTQEQQLRDELSKLGPNPTNDQVDPELSLTNIPKDTIDAPLNFLTGNAIVFPSSDIA